MFKVVAVSDKVGTAIDRLCRGVAPYHDNLDYVVCDVHPKRPDDRQLREFEQAALSADVIDFQYFRTAEMLLDRYEWLKDKKLVLTHNNPYSIYENQWERYSAVVANNQTMHKDLEAHLQRSVEHIPLAVETEQWQFNHDWQPSKRVLMVANRIESKKGIAEVARACAEIGYPFVLVGNVSDRNYFHEVLSAGNVEFHENVTDDQLRDLYYQSSVLVCNSIDNFESGTLPILEAMLCGTPVLTRRVGHVPDLDNGENLRINEYESNDVEALKKHLADMLSDVKRLEAQRQSAWNTAKNFNMERRAWLYQRLYRSLLPGTPVSVIMPVCERPDVMRKAMNAIAEQDYANLELVVVDDDPRHIENHLITSRFRSTVSFPVRYIDSSGEDYGLARARNLGIINATGDILVFCDERMVMEPDCVSRFVDNLVPNVWLYGDKSTAKKDFVENLSCIRRQDIIKFGMFNERINRYGGMSQELRSRAKLQGLETRYIAEAKAIPGAKSSNRNRKRLDIIAMKNTLFKMGL